MLTDEGLYKLLSWLSPSFPVGAFTYSHGLEYAVEAGLVTDRATVHSWIEGVILQGAGRVDADLFRETHGAVDEGDIDRFDQAVIWGQALRGTAEMALESRHQGRAFLTTLRQSDPDPRLDSWAARLGREPAYCLVVALAAALAAVPVRPALTAYLHALSANLVSAAVRLIPLGQTDGQRVQTALAPVVAMGVASTLGRSMEQLGQAAPMVDWASMCHETQYTRLFRS